MHSCYSPSQEITHLASCHPVRWSTYCTHSTVGETGSERRLEVYKVPQETVNSTMSVRQLVHGYTVPHCGPHQRELAPLNRPSSPDGSRAQCPSQPLGTVPTCSPIHCGHKREKKNKTGQCRLLQGDVGMAASIPWSTLPPRG